MAGGGGAIPSDASVHAVAWGAAEAMRIYADTIVAHVRGVEQMKCLPGGRPRQDGRVRPGTR